MKRLTYFHQPFALALALACAFAMTASALAQSPAVLAPADTPVFVHIHKPADWFGDLTQGPLGQTMRKQIETQEGSGDLLAALDMDLDQFMDAYFGQDVVVLGPGGDKDGVIFTKVSKANREHAIDSLFLQAKGDLAGNPVYVGADGEGYFVMMNEWVAMCDLNAVEYLESILKQGPNAQRLADTEFYAKWTKELPADRSMTALINESKDSQHALGVVRKGKGMDATYLGTSPDFDELMGMLGETNVAEFGPLPAETLAAMSFNLTANDDIKQQFQGLDMLLGGKTFAKDVLPKLDPPTLMFMGSVPGDAVEPNVSVDVPVVGLAMKMNDDSVAADLDQLFNSLVLIANMSVAQFEAGAVPQRTATYNGASFKVAEVGKPVAQGLEFPELAPIQIVYGQVGEYYVVCTQEEFFKKCVDANAGGKPMRIEVEGPAHRLAKTPVLAMTARPDGFGGLLLSWGKMLEAKGLPDAIAAEDEVPADLDTLFDVVTMLQQYSRMKLQVWSGDDGLVIGRAQLTAPQ
jgi:hypothetical protein